MSYISIPNWTGPKGFQHYKDRNPPWIKVYTELLSDDDYLDLTGDQRAILHGLWLEYASSSCQLRADTRSLTRRLNLRVTSRQLDRLVQAGFIELVASKSQANGYGGASPRATREETYRAETEGLDESSRSEITQATRPDLTESEEQHKEDEEPFATEPEPPVPLNGRTADEYGLQPLELDTEELVKRWSQESA